MSTTTAVKKLKASEVDVTSLGVQKGGRTTKPWGIHLQAATVQKIIELFDEWSGTGKGMKPAAGTKLPGQRYRDLLAEGKTAMVFGCAVPNKTFEMIEGLAATTKKAENFIGAWCIDKGMSVLNIEAVRKLGAGSKPSPSMVSVLALLIGLTYYPKEFPAVADADVPKKRKRTRKAKAVNADA